MAGERGAAGASRQERGGSHILIEDCSFNYSNSDGVGFGHAGSEDTVVRRCTGNRNGMRAISPAWYIFDVLIEDCITNYNNNGPRHT